MNIVFLGTPQFAVPTLEALIEDGHTIKAVFTQPDRPKGRAHEIVAPPVKEAANRFHLPVFQPARIRHPEVIEQLRDITPDAMVVVGYGQIIPQAVIDIPPLGIINVHASLLPKYRGAAPIQWAIANGEERTGVTTMRIDAGLDTGDMLLKWETDIGPEEDAVELGLRLSHAGARILVQTLRESPPPIPQNSAEATYAPILKKEDGRIDWRCPAQTIFNRVRGFLPWPGAYTSFRGQLLHIWRANACSVPGGIARLSSSGKQLYAGCGDGTSLEILELQLEGRRRMAAADFLNGIHLSDNEVLGAYS